MADSRSNAFPRSLRVTSKLDFERAYKARMSRRVGPLVVHARPNGFGHLRLGMSIPKRVGNAVVRARVRRRLREAFRLHRHAWPGSYDVIVNVRAHDVLHPDEYARLLGRTIAELHDAWQNRATPPARTDASDRG